LLAYYFYDLIDQYIRLDHGLKKVKFNSLTDIKSIGTQIRSNWRELKGQLGFIFKKPEFI